MASTVPPCGRGSVQPLWDSTKGKYVEVECPQHHHPSALRNRVPSPWCGCAAASEKRSAMLHMLDDRWLTTCGFPS